MTTIIPTGGNVSPRPQPPDFHRRTRAGNRELRLQAWWRTLFPHVSFATQFAIGSELASLARADAMAQFAAADSGGSARKGRPGRFLDLHLHQLAAHASLRPRLGREIQGSGIGGDRRALAGVRVRKEPRQRAPGREGPEGRLSGRGGQRSRHLAGLQKPILAGALFHRRARAYSASPFRRGRIRTSPRWSFSSCWPRPEPTASAVSRSRLMARGIEAAADWRNLRSPETYVGYERTQNFASPGGAVRGQAADVCSSRRGCA